MSAYTDEPKTGGGEAGSEREARPFGNPDRSGIAVRVERIYPESGSLRCTATIRVSGFEVHGLRVYNGERGLFVSMPSIQSVSPRGEIKYSKIFFPVSEESREALSMAVLSAYREQLEQMKQDGDVRNSPLYSESISRVAVNPLTY